MAKGSGKMGHGDRERDNQWCCREATAGLSDIAFGSPQLSERVSCKIGDFSNCFWRPGESAEYDRRRPPSILRTSDCRVLLRKVPFFSFEKNNFWPPPQGGNRGVTRGSPLCRLLQPAI